MRNVEIESNPYVFDLLFPICSTSGFSCRPFPLTVSFVVHARDTAKSRVHPPSKYRTSNIIFSVREIIEQRV